VSRPGRDTHAPEGNGQYLEPEEQEEPEIEDPESPDTPPPPPDDDAKPRKLPNDEEREAADQEYIERWTRKRSWAKRTLAAFLLSPLGVVLLYGASIDPIQAAANRSRANMVGQARLLALATPDCATTLRGENATVVGFEWSRRWTLEERHTTVHRGTYIPSNATELRSWKGDEALEQLADTAITRWRDEPGTHPPESYVCGSRPGPDGPVDRLCTIVKTRENWQPYFEAPPETLHPWVTVYEYSVERWEEAVTMETSGRDHEPVWSPEPEPGEHQRLVYDEQTHVLLRTARGELSKEPIPPEVWRRLALGDTVPLVVDACGASMGVEP